LWFIGGMKSSSIDLIFFLMLFFFTNKLISVIK
jgi:hypothetical protein